MNQTHNVSYKDCITGKAEVPRGGVEKTVFQIMMVFFMVTVMVTFNWNLHTPDHSPLQFALSFYEYPVMFCIALVVRLLVADPIVGRIIGGVIVRFVPAGVTQSAAITLVNVLVMSTFMGFFGLVVAGGGLEGLSLGIYASLFPATWVFAFCFSFFIVGPLVKILYHAAAAPAIEAFKEAPKNKRASATFAAIFRSKALADEAPGSIDR